MRFFLMAAMILSFTGSALAQDKIERMSIAWLKFPPNYPIPPHTHPFTEVVTVLKGKLGNGMGGTFDTANGEVLNAGDSFVLPTGHSHYVWTTDEETIVELIATGPWDITYINPEDDPRKKAK